MRKIGLDNMALLVVLGAAVLVAAVAAGTAPAYSDEAGEPVAASQPAPAEPELETTSGPDPAPQPAATASVAASAEADGYQWSGSRPAGERYLWSHRPN